MKLANLFGFLLQQFELAAQVGFLLGGVISLSGKFAANGLELGDFFVRGSELRGG